MYGAILGDIIGSPYEFDRGEKNNLIYDGTHLGLNIKGNDIIVEYNDIHDVLKTSSDMGAIYSGQIMAQRGNVFRYNKKRRFTICR